MSDEICCAYDESCSWNDDRLDRFPPALIRNSDDGDGGDPRMGRQDVFDLCGVDILAAADNHVLGAIHDIVKPVRIAAGQVAAPVPALLQHPGGPPPPFTRAPGHP